MGLYRKVNGQLETISGANASGLPIGTIIEQEKNDTIPTGYLLCDGSVFDETLYPALYMYLQSNVLPYKPIQRVDKDPDWFVTNTDSYPGSATQVPANVANQYLCFPTEAEYDGIMNFHADDWCYLHITHADGTHTDYTIRRDDSWSGLEIPVKKGDKFIINRTVDDYTNWIYVEYTYVAIWYYKDFGLIKAVSGLTEAEYETAYNSTVDYIEANLGRVQLTPQSRDYIIWLEQ